MIVFFVAQVQNDDIPKWFFHFFKIYWLLGGRGLKGQKMVQNDEKFCLTSYLRNCTSYDCDFWYTFVKWWYLQQSFSFFQKSDFSAFSKFINKCQKEILRCVPPSSHMCDFSVKLWLILSQNITCILVREVISLKTNGGVISKIYCLILWSPICTPLIALYQYKWNGKYLSHSNI